MVKHGQAFRLGSLVLVVCAGFSGLGYRLTQLHLQPDESFRASLARTRTFTETTQGSRGRIMDRNGQILALDLEIKHVALDPSYIRRHCPDHYAQSVGSRLAALLDMDRTAVMAKLHRTQRQFVYLKKNVHFDIATQIERMKFKGVLMEGDMTRHYPKGSLMAQVVGFSKVDGKGMSGVEKTMDDMLRGKNGLMVSQKDGRKKERYDRRRIEIHSAEGAQVHLTLDEYLQVIVEDALKEAVEQHHAKGAWAVLMDVRTGAILAMASVPVFDLNDFRNSNPEQQLNRSLTAVYEPGSIMKPISLAAAYNEGLYDPEEEIDCEGGRWMHRGRSLKDYHGYGLLSGADVLQKSSNIGTAKVALRLSSAQFEQYLKDFGFGSKTGIKLPGEHQGLFRPLRRWDSLTHSRVAIGHGISVTGLQICNAVNAIANDGFLMKPYVVSRVTDLEGGLIYRAEPQVLNRPVTADTARVMRRLMARVVGPGGTGRRAKPSDERYPAGGKTGTAEKTLPGGGYSDSKNIASFVGFVPVERPKFTLLVSVDEPQPLHTGGAVAAPVFKVIADEAIRYLNVQSGKEGELARLEGQK